ncbi:MAG: DMT family transporter [Tannerellaceae bacterium]
MNNEKVKGHIIILIVNVIFAINIPITKSLFPDWVSPQGLTLMRMLFACVMFWIVSFFAPKEKVDIKDFKLLIVCGLCGIALNQWSFIEGLNATSPVDASIITTGTPLFVMLFAAIILKEPITIQKAGGVLLGASGAMLLVFSSTASQSGNSSVWGDLLVISSSFIYSFYLVLVRPLTEKYSSITMMKWMFLFSSLVLLPFGYKDVLNAPAFTGTIETTTILRIFYVLFGATFVTYLMIPMALKRIRPTTVSMYNYVQPMIASFIAIVIGQDSFTLTKLFSSVLVFTGVYLVTQSKSRADLEDEKLDGQTVMQKDR